MSKWNTNFQFRSKVKVTGRQKPKKIAAYLTYMFIKLGVADQAPAAQVSTAN